MLIMAKKKMRGRRYKKYALEASIGASIKASRRHPLLEELREAIGPLAPGDALEILKTIKCWLKAHPEILQEADDSYFSPLGDSCYHAIERLLECQAGDFLVQNAVQAYGHLSRCWGAAELSQIAGPIDRALTEYMIVTDKDCPRCEQDVLQWWLHVKQGQRSVLLSCPDCSFDLYLPEDLYPSRKILAPTGQELRKMLVPTRQELKWMAEVSERETGYTPAWKSLL